MVTRNGTWAPLAVDKVEGFIFANILPYFQDGWNHVLQEISKT